MKTLAYINGVWTKETNGRTFAVVDPSTGEKIADVPDLGAEQASEAITAAFVAFSTWKRTSAKVRVF